MKNKRKGFTLAEVLITLGIIGVVAAITLPTLMQDASKQQLGVKLAKFQSNMEKITRTAAVEEDIKNKEELCNLFDSELVYDTVNKYFGASCANYKNLTDKSMPLRDGTSFKLDMENAGNVAYDVASNNIGSSVAKLQFNPNITGLSGGPSEFTFAVTNRGFVVPDQDDKCLIDIYKNKYKATKIYGTGNCKST